MLVTARKLTDLEVADGELPAPAQVERAPRTVSAPELVASAADALIALHELDRGGDAQAATDAGVAGYRDGMTDPAGERPPRRRPSADTAAVELPVVPHPVVPVTAPAPLPPPAALAPGPRRPVRTGRRRPRAPAPWTRTSPQRRASRRPGPRPDRPASRRGRRAGRHPATARNRNGVRVAGGRWPTARCCPRCSGLPPSPAVGVGGGAHRARGAASTCSGSARSAPCSPSATSSAACSRWPGCAAADCSGPLVQPPLLVAVAVPVVVLLAGSPRPGTGIAERAAGDRRTAGQRVPDDGADHRVVLALGLLRVLLQSPVGA